MADAVEAARARIDRVLNDLERKIRELKVRPEPLPDDDLFAAPATARADARVAELEAAAKDASAALTRAAEDVRDILDGAA